MTINTEIVRHVAKLARLTLLPEDEVRITDQLQHILNYVEQLNELDTEGLEPTAHSIPLTNVMRPDAVQPGLPREELLAGAPRAEDGMFRVPKIL